MTQRPVDGCGCLLCRWLAYLATEPEVVNPTAVQVDAADLDAWAADYRATP